MSEIGNLIYNRRKELGLTLEEVGKAVGVSKSTVKKWENGFISNAHEKYPHCGKAASRNRVKNRKK